MQKKNVKGDDQSARKDGIKEKYFKERKEQTKGIRKKGSANVKRCKNLCEEKGKKGAHM